MPTPSKPTRHCLSIHGSRVHSPSAPAPGSHPTQLSEPRLGSYSSCSTSVQYQRRQYSRRRTDCQWLAVESIEKRREGGGHPVGAIRRRSWSEAEGRRCRGESPLHHGLYPSFVCVYTVLAGVSTQHAADSPPVRCGAAFSIPSNVPLTTTVSRDTIHKLFPKSM